VKDERLSDLNRRLRAGDPFAGESGLTPEEVRAMRRTVLTAVPEPRRWFLPVLALAGAAVVALLIAVIALWPSFGGPPRLQPPPRLAVVPAPPAQSRVPEAEPRTTEAAQPLRVGKAEKRRPHLRRPHRSPAGESAPNGTLAALKPSVPDDRTAIREIQFSTPGGTRIIWTLTPGKPAH
jgi:hypothetical protein